MFKSITHERSSLKGRFIITDDSFIAYVPTGSGFFVDEIIKLYRSKNLNLPRNLASYYHKSFNISLWNKFAFTKITEQIYNDMQSLHMEIMTPCILNYLKWLINR